MQIMNGLIQVFMGAVSGYYTNKLAISHLFTDIPLFGNRSWKAVIKKGGNKERLAEDLSEIAEDKILGNSSERNSYLYQELSKEEVLHSLDQCVLAVFEELEQGETAQKSLVTVLREFLTRDQEKEILENVLETICSEWRLRDVISERAFTDFCMENFGKESFSEKFSLALSKETVTAKMILGEDCCGQVKERLAEKAVFIFESFQQEEERKKLEAYVDNICRKLEIGRVIENTEEALGKKTLGEVLADGVFLKPSLMEKLLSYLDTDLLRDIYESLIEELEEQNLTLSDLLPEGCLTSDAMIGLLTEKIKELQPFLCDLYENNREFISERIGEALSEVIDEGTGNFLQNMVLFGAKDLILAKTEEFLREKLPGKIEVLLGDPSKETCLALSHMLEEIPFHLVLEKLSFDAVYEYIKKEPAIQEFLAEKIKQVPLSFLWNSDSIAVVVKKAEENLPEMITGWLFSGGENKKETVKELVFAAFEKLIEMPLALPVLLEKVKDGVPEKEAVISWIYEKFSEILLKDIFTVERVEHWLDEWEDRGGITAEKVISMIPKEPVQKKIRELFLEKAAGYLKIKPVVKEKILALDDDRLCEMMQKFMGTQLAPLNRIGGAIGALVGLLVFFLHPSMELSLLPLLFTIVCYGLIGVGTNVLALYGLFRPYHLKERKWLGKISDNHSFVSGIVMRLYHIAEKIPGIRNLFCLGYMPEKKELIAGKLAEFVADNFLQGKELLPKIEIKTEMVKKFLRENQEKIADSVAEKLKQADFSRIGELLKETVSDEDIAEKIEEADLSSVSDKIYPAIEKRMEKPLGQYFSKESLTEKIGKSLHELLQGKWKTELFSWCYDRFLKQKTLGELFLENRSKVSVKMTESLCNFLYGEAFRKQAELLIYREVLKKTQKKERTVVSFFGGQAGFVLENNLEKMTGFLFDVIRKKCGQYLLEHEDALVDRLDLEIQDMINDMADGMELGGMAASMLGTRQLIGKVFERLFISEAELDAETEEVVQRERLSEELFERNRQVLSKKIEELLLSAGNVTVKQLEFLFFAQGKTRIVDKSEKEAKAQWVNRLCSFVFTAFFRGRTRCMISFYGIVDGMLKKAETFRLEELFSYVRKPVLEELEQGLWLEAEKAIGKPSAEAAVKEFLGECILNPFLSASVTEYVPLSRNFFRGLLCSCWKLIWEQPGTGALLRELFSFRGKQIPESLKKELEENIKNKDSFPAGVKELTEAVLSIAVETETVPVIEEFLSAVNGLFQYEENKPAGMGRIADQIDFAHIIELAVLDMGDAQIEELFQGFAGEYFFSLKLSGAFGFVFAVPVMRWIFAAVFIGSGLLGRKGE